jgi:acyl-CoA thioesterase
METKAADIVASMMEKDAFSRWLGIEIVSAEAGYSKLSMMVRDDMVNGFGVCHGGITFALADSALAFAANSRGKVSLALENNIHYTKKVVPGDHLFAESTEIQNGRSIGVYKISITNQDEDLVADFRGTVFRSGDEH